MVIPRVGRMDGGQADRWTGCRECGEVVKGGSQSRKVETEPLLSFFSRYYQVLR